MGHMISGSPTLTPYTGPVDLSRPHFVGIGGWGMSGLARLCHAAGSEVRGSDVADSDRVRALRELGCGIRIGHDPDVVGDASCVVYTTFTAATSETAAAREAGIPLLHRAQALQEISTGRNLVAVAGTHGKSTTTAMIATALTVLGNDPSYLIGADLDRPCSGARHGAGPLMVAEADESDRSFLFLRPLVAVVTGISHDHPENFDGVLDHLDAYTYFAGGMRPGGILVADADQLWNLDLVSRLRRLRPDVRVVTYGQAEKATARIESYERRGWTSSVGVRLPSGTLVEIALGTPAQHHARNAVGALAALMALGVDPGDAATALSGFGGVLRRFTRRGQAGGVTIVDCYADHQHEIAADLEAARAVAESGRVVAVCQPSGYVRVGEFGRDIGAVLAAGADLTVLLDIQGGEPITRVTSRIVGDAIRMKDGQVRHATSADVPSMVKAVAQPGDVVVLLGTGDVTQLAEPIMAALNSD